MNLILHIFRKDVRRLWIEILVSFAALVLYFAKQWQGFTPQDLHLYNIARPLALLVFLTWAFLVVRLTQAEPLVGQRQFWITRPYAWWQLLSAKMLFVTLCIAAPLGFAQITVLVLARLSVVPALGHIAYVVLVTICLAILPCVLTATLMRTTSQWVLRTPFAG